MTYTITCPGGAGETNKAKAVDDASTTALPDTNDEPMDGDDSDYEEEEDEDEEFEYDEEIDEDEIEDLLDEEDEDYDSEEEAEEDEDEELVYDEESGEYFFPSDFPELVKKEKKGECKDCNLKEYKKGVSAGFDPISLQFRNIDGKFVKS